MDVAAFSGDSFDAKAWINNAFKQPEAHQNKEQFASALVMKLQLMIAKLNSSLEEQCEQLSAGILRPKVLRDVESLQQEAVLLQGRISDVRNEMEHTNSENAQASMQTLIEMDKLKQRMQATSKALKEADNWTTLTTEIEDVFDGSAISSGNDHSKSGDIDLVLATTKLAGIQASLKILTHVPDYEERVLHVEGLKNRLEALASPKLVAAFNGVDADSARFFVKMFSDMERSPQLLKYYRKCIRARLLKAWAELTNQYNVEGGPFISQDANQDSLNDTENRPLLYECIQKFFAIVIACTTEQLSWFETVFVQDCQIKKDEYSTSANDNLVEILLEVYSSLDPRFDACLSAASDQILNSSANEDQEEHKHAKEKAFINFLAKLKNEFNLHVQGVDKLMLPDSKVAGLNGRLNARLRDLARLVYQCFKPYVAKYPAIEKSVLAREIKFAGVQTSKDIVDELRNVSGSVPKLIEILRLSAKRCFDLTEGCAYPSFVETVLPPTVELYSERYRSLMKRLDKRKSASHSWIILGQSLTLNQACGELVLRLEELEVALNLDFLKHVKPYLGSVESVNQIKDIGEKGIHQHDLFLLDSQNSTKNSMSAEKLRKYHKDLQNGNNFDYKVFSSYFPGFS